MAARQQQAQASVDSLTLQLPQLLAQQNGLDVQRATSQRLAQQLAESRAIREEAAQLSLLAPFAGLWRDLDPQLHPGTWVKTDTPLGIVIDPSSWVVDAYLEQQQIHRIAEGAQARFWPHNLGAPLEATVIAVDTAPSKQLPYAMLDARFGGAIATQPHAEQSQPVRAIYRVRLQLHAEPPQIRELRGTAHIDADRRSWLWHVIQTGLAVVIRESGF